MTHTRPMTALVQQRMPEVTCTGSSGFVIVITRRIIQAFGAPNTLGFMWMTRIGSDVRFDLKQFFIREHSVHLPPPPPPLSSCRLLCQF